MAAVANVFPFKATEYYISLIDWDDPNDPIRRIIVPHRAELTEDGHLDPSNEAANCVAPGVQHKYPHTALVLTTSNCAGFCRYCFRKRFFISGKHDGVQEEIAHDIDAALSYIANHSEITNVLLTGGDPLTLPTARIAYILSELRDIAHVGMIRIGTRVPVFNPHRILGDPELINVMKQVSTNQRRVYIVTHFDHPRELTDLSISAVAEFINHGIPVLNQHPILAGINDDPDTLIELYRELTAAGVATYYLFLVRPTIGNHVFEVPIVRAYQVLEEAKRRLSGIDKRLRLVMSHASGKIHVVGVDTEYIYLKYHRARDPEDEGRILICYRNDDAYWLDDLQPVHSSEHPGHWKH